jgi:hypothetical protein
MALPQSPLSYHADLYRYWDAKRGDRPMPARADIDPAELRGLLPHLTLIERVEGGFRYRLVGSKVVQDLGREMTGTMVGSHVTPPEYGRALCAIYEQVCDGGKPIFTTGEYRSPSQLVHTVSRLLVPLGPAGGAANMVLLSRASRYDRGTTVTGWLGRTAGRLGETVEVESLAQVEALTLAWDHQSLPERVPA